MLVYYLGMFLALSSLLCRYHIWKPLPALFSLWLYICSSLVMKMGQMEYDLSNCRWCQVAPTCRTVPARSLSLSAAYEKRLTHCCKKQNSRGRHYSRYRILWLPRDKGKIVTISNNSHKVIVVKIAYWICWSTWDTLQKPLLDCFGLASHFCYT